MSPKLRALLRLFAVQGSWNYERMLGPGLGYSALPLLEELARTDPQRYARAVGRAGEFFNCNPNLAGIALGASVQAEREGLPGEQIVRLKTALGGPLGALGDRLFWAGVVPGLSALALAGVALGAGLAAPITMVLVYAAIRIVVGRWALELGLREGIGVGRALRESWLPTAAERAALAAALAVGLMLPVAGRWLLGGGPTAAIALAGAVALAGTILAVRRVRGYSAVRLTVAVGVVVLLLGMAVR